MGELSLNNEYRLAYPESFHVMDESERAQLRFLTEGDGDCISDPENHILISTGWKQAGKAVLFLLSPDDLARQMQKASA